MHKTVMNVMVMMMMMRSMNTTWVLGLGNPGMKWPVCLHVISGQLDAASCLYTSTRATTTVHPSEHFELSQELLMVQCVGMLVYL